MIASVEGIVTHKDGRSLIVAVSGIGYQIFVTPSTLSKQNTGNTLFLWTHQVIREDANDLYGFQSMEEKDLFEILISVSGIGPRSGLAILSLSSPNVLKQAIAAGNTNYLTQVSGIGKRLAEKIVVELRDKMADLYGTATDQLVGGDSDVLEALRTLGYSASEGREILKQIPAEISDTKERIKRALSLLQK